MPARQQRHPPRRLLPLAAALLCLASLAGSTAAALSWCLSTAHSTRGWSAPASASAGLRRRASLVGEAAPRAALVSSQAAGRPSRRSSVDGAAAATAATSSFLGLTGSQWRWLGALALALRLIIQRVKVWLETPSRPYSSDVASNSVRAEYDNWTREGVLEHYWGEHIHMGAYTSADEQRGFERSDPTIVAFLRASLRHLTGGLKNFIQAKLDFSKEMLAWSGAKSPKRILDVGCGIGGTSRFLAQTFPDAEVIGITLSPQQVERATELAKEAGLTNVKFAVVNALDMSFADDTFDLVWGCESGEHMPDKKKYVEEMTRVLAPGGNLVIAVWCERDPVPPFTNEERTTLKFVYEEWSHPYFISISAFDRLLKETGSLEVVETDDWTERTLPSWRHSVWVGVWSPWYWMKVTLQRPKAFLGFVRDAYTLERYHRAMRNGLLNYGMMKARKKAEVST